MTHGLRGGRPRADRDLREGGTRSGCGAPGRRLVHRDLAPAEVSLPFLGDDSLDEMAHDHLGIAIDGQETSPTP